MKKLLKGTNPLKNVFKLLLILAVIGSGYLWYLRFVPIHSSSFIKTQNSLARENPQIYLKANQQWVDFEAISPDLVLALIASEDQIFLGHFGFDFVQILDSLKSYQTGNKLRGASTITQQLVKNMFLWNTGNKEWRKFLEAGIVPFVEIVWSKQRIIEVYLNVAQFDDITYGVELASQKYFNKSANNVSKAEAAWLIAVLPAPVKYSIKNPTAKLQQRQVRILQQMRKLKGVELKL